MGSRVEFPFSRTTNSLYRDLVNMGEKRKILYEEIVSKTLGLVKTCWVAGKIEE